MSIYTILLLLLHLARVVLHACRNVVRIFTPKRAPKPLQADRRRIPKHLAVCFQDAGLEDAQVLLESCKSIEGWARQIGVQELSFYDRQGVLQRHQTILRELLPAAISPISTPPAREMHLELPLTPPASSRPTPPSSIDGLSDSDTPTRKDVRRRRKGLSAPTRTLEDPSKYPPPRVEVLSFDHSKPLIAVAAQTLASRARTRPPSSKRVSVAEIDELVKASFSSPDLLLIHPVRPTTLSAFAVIPRPLELCGFPPWHIDLSEMYHEPPRFRLPIPRLWRGPWRLPGEAIREDEFRRALDSYEKAEMRKGR